MIRGSAAEIHDKTPRTNDGQGKIAIHCDIPNGYFERLPKLYQIGILDKEKVYIKTRDFLSCASKKPVDYDRSEGNMIAAVQDLPHLGTESPSLCLCLRNIHQAAFSPQFDSSRKEIEFGRQTERSKTVCTASE